MKRTRNPGHTILSRHYAHRWRVALPKGPAPALCCPPLRSCARLLAALSSSLN